MRKAGKILSAGVIFQMLTASGAFATDAAERKHKDSAAEIQEASFLSASEILLKMHAADLTLTDPQGRFLIGAYRVMVTGAA